MTLIDWFRPRWRHSNANVRLKAVEVVSNQQVLAALALDDPNNGVRREAAAKLSDLTMLHNVALNAHDELIRLEVVRRITDQSVLKQVLQRDRDPVVRRVAAGRLLDPRLVLELVANDEQKVRDVAYKYVEYQDVIRDLARGHADVGVRSLAADLLTDEKDLLEISLRDANGEVRGVAARKIHNQDALRELVLTDEDASVRRSAIPQLTDQATVAIAIRKEPDSWYREHLIDYLTDEAVLFSLACEDPSEIVARSAFTRLTDPGVVSSVLQHAIDVGTTCLSDCSMLSHFLGRYLVSQECERIPIHTRSHPNAGIVEQDMFHKMGTRVVNDGIAPAVCEVWILDATELLILTPQISRDGIEDLWETVNMKVERFTSDEFVRTHDWQALVRVLIQSLKALQSRT